MQTSIYNQSNPVIKLALEFSAVVGSIAIAVDDNVYEHTLSGVSRNQDLLLKELDNMLNQHDVMLSQLGLIVWGNGPGSFTGIRLAASWVQSFSYAANIPVYGVSSLKNIAFQALSHSDYSEVSVLVDAKLSKHYFGRYKNTSQGIESLQPDQLIYADQVPNDDYLVSDLDEHPFVPNAKTAIMLTNQAIANGRLDTQTWRDVSPQYLNNQLYHQKKKTDEL